MPVPAFAQVLKQARERSKLTPGQLSYKAEVPEPTIRRIEDGKIPNPGMVNIGRLVGVLNLDCDELRAIFGLRRGPGRAKTARQNRVRELAQQQTAKVARNWGDFSEEEQAEAWEYVLFRRSLREREELTEQQAPEQPE
jgi:transcriptional regulator with XRE-family HTH domain